MRRLLCLPLLTALLLAGCGDGSAEPTAEQEASATAAGRLDRVSVEGEPGEKPVVQVQGELRVGETVREVLREGDGEQVERGQKVTISYVGVNARSGEEFDSSYGQQPATFTLDESVIPGFAEGLTGVPVGSRVLVAVSPEDGYGPQGGVPDADIRAGDTLLFVIDVQEAGDVRARAEGEAVTPAPGLPTVELAEDGAPSVTLPDGDPPGELVAQPLIAGEGPRVEAGQVITAHYTGLTWPGGEVFDSSWERGSPAQFTIGTGAVIEGWDQGLVGRRVGSQVLLVVPPALGYGESGNPQAGIEGTDTLVFVVDILDVSPAPAG